MRAIRRVVESTGASANTEPPEEATGGWVELYRRGDAKGALSVLGDEIAKQPRRPLAARLYNDQGYIAYGIQDRVDFSRRSLERALNVHHYYLPITLLNLAVISIDLGEFAAAIAQIDDALLLIDSQPRGRGLPPTTAPSRRSPADDSASEVGAEPRTRARSCLRQSRLRHGESDGL